MAALRPTSVDRFRVLGEWVILSDFGFMRPLPGLMYEKSVFQTSLWLQLPSDISFRPLVRRSMAGKTSSSSCCVAKFSADLLGGPARWSHRHGSSVEDEACGVRGTDIGLPPVPVVGSGCRQQRDNGIVRFFEPVRTDNEASAVTGGLVAWWPVYCRFPTLSISPFLTSFIREALRSSPVLPAPCTRPPSRTVRFLPPLFPLG